MQHELQHGKGRPGGRPSRARMRRSGAGRTPRLRPLVRLSLERLQLGPGALQLLGRGIERRARPCGVELLLGLAQRLEPVGVVQLPPPRVQLAPDLAGRMFVAVHVGVYRALLDQAC
jgi:hypothetical protein